MKIFSFFICVAFLAIVSAKRQRCFPVTPAPNQCLKPFTSYTTCGSACPATCETLGKEVICTKQCVAGCFCNKGYVLDKKKNCIPISECPPVVPVCAANEEYSECGANSCQKNCDILYLNVACRPTCTPGCICKEGYIKDSEGVCILIKDCPKVCSTNQEYSECGAHGCRNTCKEPALVTYCDPAPGCYAGCICKEGYLLDSEGACIPIEDCPKVCASNEEYSECGANGCQNTCENPTLGQVCRATCIAGCICNEGYLRDSNYICVAADSCLISAN